jgi:hypothetical protein
MRPFLFALTVALAAAATVPPVTAAPRAAKPRAGAFYLGVVRSKQRPVGQVHFRVSKTGHRLLAPSITFTATCRTQYGDRVAVRKVLAVFTGLRVPIKRTRRSSTVAFTGEDLDISLGQDNPVPVRGDLTLRVRFGRGGVARGSHRLSLVDGEGRACSVKRTRWTARPS